MARKFRTIYILYLLCFLPVQLLADEPVKIARVLDANLFELKDGRKIRLANLDAPSIHDPDPYRAALAKMIKKYGQEQLAGQTVLAEFTAQRDSACDCFPVHLFRKFTLKTVWYNQSYLEKGYGAYLASPDSTYHSRRDGYPREYVAASEAARMSKRGIWDPARYKPRPNRYALNLLAGAGDRPGFSDDYYRELYVSYEPVRYQSAFSIVFGLMQTKAVDEPEAPIGYPGSEIRTFNLPYLIPQIRVQTDYFGFNLGIFFNVRVFSRGYPIPFLFPSISLKAGFLRAFYLSADLLNDFLFGPSSIGLNLRIAHPDIHLWIGNTAFGEGGSVPGLRLNVLIAGRYLLKAQGAYDFGEPEKRYGFRVGMGYVLGTR